MYSWALSFASLSSLLRGTRAFPETPSPTKFARLASLSHTHTVCMCVTINICRHAHKHADKHIYRSINREPDRKGRESPRWHSILLHLDGAICCVTSGLICSSLQQLRKDVDPMSTKWLTEPWADISAWMFPAEINILRVSVLCFSQWATLTHNPMLDSWISSAVFSSPCSVKPWIFTGHF